MMDREELKRLALAATPGPWDFDTEKNDGEYGHYGPDSKAGFNSYAIHCEAGTLFDTLNSDMAVVHEEWDEDSFYAWDDVGKCNAAFVAAANPSAILSLLALLEEKEAEIAKDEIWYEELRKEFNALRASRKQDIETAIEMALEESCFSYANSPRRLEVRANVLSQMELPTNGN